MPTKTASRSVAKKAPVKKTAVAKKTVKKSVAKASLTYAGNSESFWLSDGQILNNLVALRDALATMNKTIYGHHVTKSKNDFAEWVEQVLGDVACAKSLRAAKTPAAAKTAVVKHLKNYNL
jgi:hypothetical protein